MLRKILLLVFIINFIACSSDSNDSNNTNDDSENIDNDNPDNDDNNDEGDDEGDGDGDSSEAPEPTFELVWQDEFNTDGSIDTEKWKFETVAPNNGSWWNGEKQHYTDRQDNAYVSDGTLKIIAKKEEFTSGGSTQQYTSARLNSKFSFTYGRLEVRAKLPEGEGTWPAIWTLGSNIETVGWPQCGEIDIMEHWGHDPQETHSATHKPSCSGDCNNARVGTTTVNDFNTAFHIYGMEWDEDEIRFYLDGEFLYEYNPATKNSDTWPFTEDQFILLNVAMGGSWFNIDPNFTESQMEIDYVRVFQKED